MRPLVCLLLPLISATLVVNCKPLDNANAPSRQARQVLASGSEVVATDSLGTPVLTTGLDVALASTGMDMSGLGGLGVAGVSATLADAVGQYNVLSQFYNFIPVDTTTSLYILPTNLQAFIPDDQFLIASPPLYDNFQLACDLYGTNMCYYYYY